MTNEAVDSLLNWHLHIGSDINFEKTYEDPNAVATLLKMFLRDLPEPVLTKHLDPVFNGCLSDYDHELSATDPEYERLISRRLAAVATHLPDENYELLAWLMCHLARVDYYSDINKMNCSNLGLIFCPTLGISSVMF
ncbi:MAG: Rho GTPase activation protein, partial [Olpidium bornovanus]